MSKDRLTRLSQTLLRRNTWFVSLFQACLVFISLVLAWLLRFDFSLPNRHLLFSVAPILIAVRLAAIARFGLLHGWWRYVGISDALDILKADLVGSIGFFLSVRVLLGITGIPRSIYILEALLTAALLAGVRLLTRILFETVHQDDKSSKPVVLIGAGFAAQMVLRELRQSSSGYQVIACVDDDRSKIGVRIQGVPVAGTVDDLPLIFPDRSDYEVIIAVPSATGVQMRRFVAVCERARVKFRTVPALREMISGEVTVKQFREVNLDDLLGRDCVQIDLGVVRQQLQGKAVMITGAAGSIGSELSRQILRYRPARLICMDQGETGLFFLRFDLNTGASGADVVYRVADICDSERLRSLLLEFRPEIIFHAAAYKHVPMMESNPQEAVKNNVLALLSLLNLADEAGCKSFVLISSDKAVNPTNIMGATKRIGELIISSRPTNGMRCVSVRFGNVLGSSGSVIPVLKEQLRKDQPLTITHPEIKRFFMVRPEAVALVLQAFAIGNQGDILVLDMGEPMRILDLARNLIRLSGKSERDVEIRFTGLRDGEKLKEELFYEHENVLPTSCEKVKRTNGPVGDWTELHRQLEELRVSISVDGAGPIRAKIKQIVPEYTFQEAHTIEGDFEVLAWSTMKKAAGQD